MKSVLVLLTKGLYEDAVEMTSRGRIYISSFMLVDSDIQATVRLLSQQFQNLQHSY
jgi:hypothetical protein